MYGDHVLEHVLEDVITVLQVPSYRVTALRVPSYLHEVDGDHVLELEREERGPRETEEALVPPARTLDPLLPFSARNLQKII